MKATFKALSIMFWSILKLIVFLLVVTGCQKERTHDFVPMVNAFENEARYFADQDPGQLFHLVPHEHSNITFSNTFRETFEYNIWSFMYYTIGSGLGAGDINNDGLIDLFFAGGLGENALYLNKGNLEFEDISKNAGISDSKGFKTGVTMIDINGDGFLDIYVCKTGTFETEFLRNKFYINNGDNTFTEKATELGLDDPSLSTHANFIDYDKDGDLDMYLLNHPNDFNQRNQVKSYTKIEKGVNMSDKFFRNNGDGTFSDVSIAAGINNHAYGLSCSVGDLNQDGWDDLLICNDFLMHDMIYINQKDGTFQQQMHEMLGKTSRYSMGSDISDFNNDGLLDFAIADVDMRTNHDRKTDRGNSMGWGVQEFEEIVNSGYYYQYPRNTLQLNNGNGTFTEMANFAGVFSTNWSWAMLFGDYDLDGWKDLFVSNGFMIQFDEDLKDQHKELSTAVRQNDEDLFYKVRMAMQRKHLKYPNEIFRNNGDLRFTRKTEDWGLSLPTLSHSAITADLDNDGDLDLVSSNTNQKATVYKNNSEERSDGKFLKVKLKGTEKNRDAWGSKVELITKTGQYQFRHQSPVKGYQSTCPPILHFGIPDGEDIEKLSVVWPDGTVSEHLEITLNQEIEIEQASGNTISVNAAPVKPMFTNVTLKLMKEPFIHKENTYDDFASQFLLHHKQSQHGPGIDVGDLNGDGLEDFFVGGAKGQEGGLYLKEASGKFIRQNSEFLNDDIAFEDQAIAFFDFDNDKDLDIYIATGSGEYGEDPQLLQDRLYQNNGLGEFSRTTGVLPEITTNTGCVIANDIDNDGDVDLFVGGRVKAAQYPNPPRSYFLINDGGVFKDHTSKICPELELGGMITDAVWTDFNNDGWTDLIVVGEWMPIRFFQNDKGSLFEVTKTTGLANMEGWWNSITQADLDGDGDEDYIVGNIGLNYYYSASAEQPFELFYHDFDENGQKDLVYSYYLDGKRYPTHTFRYLSEKMPILKQELRTYSKFGASTTDQIFDSKGLNQAQYFKASIFANIIIENKGGMQFEKHLLPNRAQMIPIQDVIAEDFNQDGFIDLLCAGNFFPTAPLFEKIDHAQGVLLIGNGQLEFTVHSMSKMGLCGSGDVRILRKHNASSPSTNHIFVVRNNDQLDILEY